MFMEVNPGPSHKFHSQFNYFSRCWYKSHLSIVCCQSRQPWWAPKGPKVSEGGVPQFYRDSKGVVSFFYTHKKRNRTTQNIPYAQFPPSWMPLSRDSPLLPWLASGTPGWFEFVIVLAGSATYGCALRLYRIHACLLHVFCMTWMYVAHLHVYAWSGCRCICGYTAVSWNSSTVVKLALVHLHLKSHMILQKRKKSQVHLKVNLHGSGIPDLD